MGKEVNSSMLRCKNRKKLAEVVPIATPFLVNLEPTNLCNFKCRFCPTGHPDLLKKVGRRPVSMTLELFKKAVDDMKCFPEKNKVVNLYKDGEPLLHKNFPAMYAYLKNAEVAERIIVKTNGALLTPELSDKILDAGITQLDISVEAVNKEGYKKLSQVDIDYDEFLDNIRYFHSRRKNCKLYIKIIDAALTPEEKEKFVSDFAPICDEYAIEQITGWSYSELNDFTLGMQSETAFAGDKLIDKMVCPLTLYALAINSDGTVSICCCDWAHKTLVGDLTGESLLEVWHGQRLKEFRLLHLRGMRQENPACRDCILMKSAPDNVDADADKIIQALQNAESNAEQI